MEELLKKNMDNYRKYNDLSAICRWKSLFLVFTYNLVNFIFLRFEAEIIMDYLWNRGFTTRCLIY